MSVREYSIIILHSKLPQVPEELMLRTCILTRYSQVCSCMITCQCDFSLGPSCNSCGFMLHCQHDSFPGPSCNHCGFMLHCQCDSSLGPSCNSHGFVLTILLRCSLITFTASCCTLFSRSFMELLRLHAALSA